MFLETGNILLIGSLLLLVSVIAGKTIRKLGVPTLIFFLLVGIGAGSQGIGGIHFDNAKQAQFIGIVALNFILFSGGLNTDAKSIRPVLWKGISLSTIGVLVTAITVGLFVHYFFGFTIAEGLLLGSVISATDAAAVFSILRTRGIALKGPLRPLLELESGSNDPMAYFLTITMTIVVINGRYQPLILALAFLQDFLLGGAMGLLMGKVSVWLINRINLESEGLYPALTLGLALFSYSCTHAIGGNGFLAIYLCAVIVGNSHMVHRRSLIRFYEGQAWLMQIILFLTLGLLVYPTHIFPLVAMGLAISAFLIFIARPTGVFLALFLSRMNLRSKLFLSWVGLRGSVPIVFATYPLLAGIQKADTIFNLVFFISVTSVLFQGTTLGFVARLLKVDLPVKLRRRQGMELEGLVRTERREIFLPEGVSAVGRTIVALGVPPSVTILSIQRADVYITPVGSTRLLAGDRLFAVAEDTKGMELFLRKLGLIDAAPLPPPRGDHI